MRKKAVKKERVPSWWSDFYFTVFRKKNWWKILDKSVFIQDISCQLFCSFSSSFFLLESCLVEGKEEEVEVGEHLLLPQRLPLQRVPQSQLRQSLKFSLRFSLPRSRFAICF
jgi:hypothetical protein